MINSSENENKKLLSPIDSWETYKCEFRCGFCELYMSAPSQKYQTRYMCPNCSGVYCYECATKVHNTYERCEKNIKIRFQRDSVFRRNNGLSY